jgi:signal transduction histidine kinase
VGFPQKEHKKSEGMGLEIMRFRARIIGGSFGIQRAQKGGTVVICRFPFCS